ncbi:MAG: FAD-dependent oxidoreductase [Kiritimatiellae bacterium]|nr:FAD-dependent oxidoreductase [Kiritimatiellia bacterium]
MGTTIQHLTGEPADVAVIGGGIHGATLAWAAAARGLRVALVEQRDFGHATSANSLKILHGGLRYLQHADLMRMWESIRARRRGLQLQPHLVRPATFLVPTYPWKLQSRMGMAAALLFNDIMSWNRNRGVAQGRRLPRGRLLSRRDAKTILQGASGPAPTGAAVWHDAIIENTERFTLGFIMSAEERGARVANYTRATGLLMAGGAVEGIRVRDEETGEEGEVRARMVVDTAGPWTGSVLPKDIRRPDWAWTRGFSLIVRRRLFGDYGVGLEGRTTHYDPDAIFQRGKQNVFFAPWREGTLIGVVYKLYGGPPDACRLEPEEIETYLKEINAIYPPAKLTLADVTFAHLGVLPAPAGPARKGNPDPCKHTEIVDFSRTAGLRGLLAVRGVKYTTALTVADRVVEIIGRRLGVNLRGSTPATVYGGERIVEPADVEASCRARGLALTPDQQRHLAAEYGSRFEEVLRIAAEYGGARAAIAGGQPVLGAEVLHAVRREHARTLGDVVLRRTNLGTLAYPGTDTLGTCARLMAGELGWDAERIEREVADVQEHYRRLGLSHVL